MSDCVLIGILLDNEFILRKIHYYNTKDELEEIFNSYQTNELCKYFFDNFVLSHDILLDDKYESLGSNNKSFVISLNFYPVTEPDADSIIDWVSGKTNISANVCDIDNITLKIQQTYQKVRYVSLGILDDLRFTHKKIATFVTNDELTDIVKKWWELLFDISYLHWSSDFRKDDYYLYANELLETNCICWNRVEKYYVVCFSIDFEPCNIYSKDCDVEKIDWNTGREHNYDNTNIESLTYEMEERMHKYNIINILTNF